VNFTYNYLRMKKNYTCNKHEWYNISIEHIPCQTCYLCGKTITKKEVKIMELNEILKDMSKIVDKDSKYLKGLYTKSKNELTEQFGEAITDDRIMSLALSKVGKQYGMAQGDVDRLINGDEEEDDLDFLDDDKDDDGLTIYDDVEDVPKPTGASGNFGWESVMQNVADPTIKRKGEFVKTPSLILELGPTYYLKVDMSEDVYQHSGEGKYGPYTSTAVKVFLIKLSDSDMYDMKYTKGDFAGQPAFVNGNRYTFWMYEKALGFFKLFWMKHTGMPIPDDRIFTFKHTKKAGKNVFQFGLPK